VTSLRPAAAALLGVAAAAFAGCGADPYPAEPAGTLHMYLIQEMKGFDPPQADEEISSSCVLNVYDQLYEYHYLKRPFELVPCLATAMPEVSTDGLTVTIHLKKGVRYADDPCFEKTGGKGREMTASDVIYDFLRLMDVHVDAKGTWIFEGKIVGLDEFHEASGKAEKNPHRAAYTAAEGYPEVPGLQAPDPYTLVIRLKEPYPQLKWVLAMGYSSVYAPEAVGKYGDLFREHPVGTGPYVVESYDPQQRLVLRRNPSYRTDDVYPSEGNPGDEALGRLNDRGKRLPLNDRVVATVFKETQPMWLYFQSGFLDRVGIPKDNFSVAIDPQTMDLLGDMKGRGITLDKDPRLEVIYDCFNMKDPVVGAGEKGRAIRRAMSLANDEDWAREHLYNNRVSSVQGPIIAEFPEFDPKFVNPWKKRPDETREQALVRARKVLADAGFPGGRGVPPIYQEVQDDATSSQFFLASQRDFADVGLRLEPYKVTWQEMNTRVSKAQAQMWGISWGADYPEAQNFLQLFYGPNESPGPNGSNYHDAGFDRMYEAALKMPEGRERTELYRKMERQVVDECVWIFKYRRLNFNLIHPWLHGYRYNDISLKYYKYCHVDVAARNAATAKLNVPNRWPALAFVAAFALLAAVTVTSSRRARKGW
jgi:ABC-type transport system substrate-binding protein